MKENSTSFNCFGTKRILFSFKCERCGTLLKEETETIPQPNYDAENDSESKVSLEECISCKCGKNYPYEIFCGMYSGGELIVHDISPSVEVLVKEISPL